MTRTFTAACSARNETHSRDRKLGQKIAADVVAQGGAERRAIQYFHGHGFRAGGRYDLSCQQPFRAGPVLRIGFDDEQQRKQEAAEKSRREWREHAWRN